MKEEEEIKILILILMKISIDKIVRINAKMKKKIVLNNAEKNQKVRKKNGLAKRNA